MLIGNLKEMIGRAVGAVPGPEAEPDMDKPFPLPNRKTLRQNRRSVPGSYHKPRSRTGSPDWFRSMKIKVQIQKALEGLPLSALNLPERYVEGLNGLGYTNVWELSQANQGDLLSAKGIGPAALKTIRAALVSRSVPVAWKAD